MKDLRSGFPGACAGSHSYFDRGCFSGRASSRLQDLEQHFPKSGARAGVAYAQSVHFVGFLIQRDGNDKLLECLRLARTTTLDFDDILTRVYGEGLSDLEEDWRTEVEPR